MSKKLVDQPTFNAIKEALLGFAADYKEAQDSALFFLEQNYDVIPNISTAILLEADDRIHGERVKTYGPATDTFKTIATIVSQLTGKEITPRDCLLMQVMQKLIRDRFSPTNQDHRRDACGYLGILDDIEVPKFNVEGVQTGRFTSSKANFEEVPR